MKSSRKLNYLILIAVAIAVVLLLPPAAEAQCSMCRAVLSNSNAKFIRNLNLGVLVLLVPPVSMFCTIFVVLRRHSKEAGKEVGSLESGVESPEKEVGSRESGVESPESIER
jgi:H+/Cl- antiporter ClcA